MRILQNLEDTRNVNAAFTLVFKSNVAVQCRQLCWNETSLEWLSPYGGWEDVSEERLKLEYERFPHCFMAHENSTT